MTTVHYELFEFSLVSVCQNGAFFETVRESYRISMMQATTVDEGGDSLTYHDISPCDMVEFVNN